MREKPMTLLTSREFNQDAGKAKKAALEGPVFITDRGRPSHVLLTIEAYQRLVGERVGSIVDQLAFEGDVDDGFEPGRLGDIARPAALD